MYNPELSKRTNHIFRDLPWGTNNNFIYITASQHTQASLMKIHDWAVGSSSGTVHGKAIFIMCVLQKILN